MNQQNKRDMKPTTYRKSKIRHYGNVEETILVNIHTPFFDIFDQFFFDSNSM